jgi:NTP pyrophosphatase (non-canonical NTP hydrolase)
MSTDRLESVVRELRAFVAERDWSQFHDPKNLAMAVGSEAGELLAEYRWVRSDEADRWSREEKNRDRVEREAADVAIALLLLCDRVGIDLVDAIRRKIGENGKKYPVKLSRGRADRPRRC